MGNSPTGTNESTDEEPEEEEPEVHPDQTDFDEHNTPDIDNSDENTSTSPSEGSVGGSGGPGAAPVTTNGEEAPEKDDSEDEPEEERSPEAGDSHELPELEESEQSEKTDDAENENENEESEQNEAKMTIYTDPWDVTGWDNEPDLRRLQEAFGDKITVEYEVLPARLIEEWEEDTEMPTVSDPNLPDSTTESYRALTAAQEQSLARKYLRRLRVAALSEGRDIESEDVLVELAEEIGLDANQLREDMENVEVRDLEPVEATPQMEVTISGVPHFWTENIEFGRVFGRIVGEGVQPDPTGRSIPQFIAEYEPVETAEVAETFELERDQATEKLRLQENVVTRNFGAGTFWLTV